MIGPRPVNLPEPSASWLLSAMRDQRPRLAMSVYRELSRTLLQLAWSAYGLGANDIADTIGE